MSEQWKECNNRSKLPANWKTKQDSHFSWASPAGHIRGEKHSVTALCSAFSRREALCSYESLLRMKKTVPLRSLSHLQNFTPGPGLNWPLLSAIPTILLDSSLMPGLLPATGLCSCSILHLQHPFLPFFTWQTSLQSLRSAHRPPLLRRLSHSTKKRLVLLPPVPYGY